MTLAMLLIPLVAAALMLLTRSVGWHSALAFMSGVATFVVSLLLPGDPGISLLWIPIFGVYFELNPLGAASVMCVSASLVMVPTLLYAAQKVTDRRAAFMALLLTMQASLNGIFLAKDLVMFYLFWEVTLIASVLLLGIWGREKRRQAALKYLLYMVTGSFFMLVSILAIKPLSGAASYRVADLLAATTQLDVATQTWLFLGFVLAFCAKLPMWPLHSWLPDVHENNHPSGVADVAGSLYKAGGLGFFAWAIPLMPEGAKVVAPILMYLAAFTAVYCAVIATAQTDLKRLLAYASLSHMGIVGVGVFGLHIVGLQGAIFLLAAQMLTTGGMFLISGILYERKRTFHLDKYGGLAKSAPALAAVSLFILFASIGVPGLANFPGEFMSLMGGFQSNPWLASFATLAVIAAGVYGVNLYQRLYQGEQTEATWDLKPLEVLLVVPVIAGILWLGLAPNPQLERIADQARLVERSLTMSQPPTEPDGQITLGEQP
ncbi:MAG: NADH:ubiquinone oxidoreductase subunit 4 (chain M) [Chloroflexi bacterium AL-N5]|nr:NADH:ubiquinone oxidoreductase subunit 4 (chain M) [Chloroflexi bacterium AL-N5]